MKTHYSAAELVGFPGLPATTQGINIRAKNENWPTKRREDRTHAWEYPVTALPLDTRFEIARRAAAEAPPPGKPAPVGPKGIIPQDNKARARSEARHAVVRALEVFLADGALPRWSGTHAFCRAYNNGMIPVGIEALRQIPHVCVTSLESWRRKIALDGVAALAGQYGVHRKGKGLVSANPAIEDFLLANLVARPHMDAAQMMQGLRARFSEALDVPLPSYRTVQRFLRSWKEENAALFMSVRNPDEYKNKLKFAPGSQSEAVLGLNHQWQADSTPTDVMLVDGRYAIVGVIDVWSRRGKVLVTPTSKGVAVTTLLRRAILAWGVPFTVKTDNGQDYVSKQVARGLADLGIEHVTCAPFSPEQKPHIERFLGTQAHQFLEILPGYIGHSVADRKEIEARKSFAERLGKSDENLLCIEMTAADLQTKLDEWCEYVYGRASHKGLSGKSPFERANEWTGDLRRVADERALDILLAEAPGDGTRKVGKTGIRLDNGMFVAADGALGLHAGKDVHVRYDPADMGRIYVYEAESGAFITVAECPERTGISRAEAAAKTIDVQKKLMAEGKKELKAKVKAVKPEHIAEEILGHAKAAAAKVVSLPRAGTAHETPALKEAAAAARHGRGIVPAELTEAQFRRQQALEAEMAAPAQIVVLETAESRFARALGIERRIDAGEDVAIEERGWLGRYRATSEYRARRQMVEDFGEMAVKAG